MCGILIFKEKNLTNKTKKIFNSTLDGLKNRGPDELKIVQSKNILVGFTRLSINDIDNASQPFKSLCGKYLIVFNGEIVNYKDLASQLSEKKIKMRYGHEAEVIINLFILHGSKCLNFLRGFFAFVIIEIKSGNIFAAVDRFSIKPLYYFQNKTKNLTIITSDFSVLIKNNLVKKELNLSKLLDYFSLARDFDDSTIFKDVKKLKASTIFTLKNDQIKTFKYWQPFKRILNIDNYKNTKNLINNKIDEITNLWKVAETKISLCLSSGVDSQILNHFFYKNKIDLTRFTLKESERKFFQFDQAVKVQPDLKKIIFLLNEFTKSSYNPFPLAHSSSLSLFQLYNEIKLKKFKFTLNGEGSDELFGGYDRYKKQLQLVKNKKFSFSKMIIEIYKNEINNVKNNFKKSLVANYEKDLLKKVKGVTLQSTKTENKILEFDQISWIPVLIQRHDFIGMHYGLEVRPPFLDHEFVELINSLPINMKYNLYNTKIFLRNLLKEKFNYNTKKNKIGTPSFFREVMSNKKEINNFKESVFYGECRKFLNSERTIKKIKSGYKNEDSIFLWRLYILNKIFYNF